MSILSAHEISKSYKLRKVVNSLSLEIKSGEVVGLLGPNGAGKTTAFYMIVGLVSADKGQILLDGQDLTSLAMHRRSKMGLGYLPQEASVFRKLTVEQKMKVLLRVLIKKGLITEGDLRREMNFLQSFGMSGLICVTTMCNLVHDEREDGTIERFIVILKLFCISYSVFGLIVSIIIYGRKVHKLDKENF